MQENKFKREILAIVEAKGLCSVMNNTKWRELQAAMETLAFPPPYQIKQVHKPCTAEFAEDVWYVGDWSDEAMQPFFAIEWIQVRPRYTKHVGQLVKPTVIDETAEFQAVLQSCHIPYEEDGHGGFMIYGYR